MKNFSIIFFITLIVFIISNILVSFTWPIYSKFKNNNHKYIDEQIEVLDMSQKDLNILYSEMWRNYEKFKFLPFIGHTETQRVGKFLNFSELDGRKVTQSKNCEKNIYLYGGSTMFGYNVTDNDTIAQKLQDELNSTYCVFNHGRAYYYSKQENNLFFNHLENGHNIHAAIFLDGLNERCGGYEYDEFLSKSFFLLVQKPYKIWKDTSVKFLISLPVVQFYNSLFGKSRWIDLGNDILEIDSCEKKIDLASLFQTRVNIRHSVCENLNINCLTFLQPLAGVHGNQIEKLLPIKTQKELKKKYLKLKKVKNYVLDLTFVLEDDTNLSYVDGVHYTPASNKKIAMGIKSQLMK